MILPRLENAEDLIKENLSYKSVYPKKDDKSNYVGIELEFIISQGNINKLEILLMNYNLLNKVTLTDDSSIDYDYYANLEGMEIRVLDTETNIKNTMKQVIKILKLCGVEVNSSCGLHVHMDARNRNKTKLFDNFIMCQEYLYSLVSRSRKDNDYCAYRSIFGGKAENNLTEHYYGVSKSSQCNTIEIRMHESTLNLKKINRWLDLLIVIANRKTKLKRNLQIIPKDVIIKRLGLVA